MSVLKQPYSGTIDGAIESIASWMPIGLIKAPYHHQCVSMTSAFGLTLQDLIEGTGELEHLNILVLKHLEDVGGFNGKDEYFTLVHPLLDALEKHLRERLSPDMSLEEVKQIIHDWIEAELNRTSPPAGHP